MRRLSPTVIAALFFIVIDSAVFYGTYLRRVAEITPVTLSAPAPEFEWKDFDGKTHKFKDLAGHITVLHFWASWCSPCREEFPHLLKAAQMNKDITFLTVSIDEDRKKAQHFIKMAPDLTGLTSPSNVLYGWDPDKTIAYDEFFTTQYPESIVVDAHQHMRRKFPSSADWTGEKMDVFFKELRRDK